MAGDREESSGEVTDSRRSLPRKKAERRESAGEGMEAGCRSWEHHGVQVEVLGLTGRVAVDVQLPRGFYASIGRRLSKLNRCLKLAIAVTETRSSSMFYSRFTQWFWLRFVPMDRATRVLQVCSKDQSLVRPRTQSAKLPSTLSANCVGQDFGRFG